jgi:hypothetical protein
MFHIFKIYATAKDESIFILSKFWATMSYDYVQFKNLVKISTNTQGFRFLLGTIYHAFRHTFKLLNLLFNLHSLKQISD